MIVNSPKDNDFTNVKQIGIAITPYDNKARQNHIGIVYKLGETTPSILHYDATAIEGEATCEEKYLWLDLGSDYTELDRTIICMHAKKVADANNEQPVAYGYDVPLGKFIDGETGEFIPKPGDFGLTCASFVVEVFESCGFSILDASSWPRSIDEDKVWQENMLWAQKGGRHDIPEEGLAKQFKNIGNSRFRPEQVAASTQCSRPACHGATLQPARKIRKHLIAHYFDLNKSTSKE